jgi:hypothetical protein
VTREYNDDYVIKKRMPYNLQLELVVNVKMKDLKEEEPGITGKMILYGIRMTEIMKVIKLLPVTMFKMWDLKCQN